MFLYWMATLLVRVERSIIVLHLVVLIAYHCVWRQSIHCILYCMLDQTSKLQKKKKIKNKDIHSPFCCSDETNQQVGTDAPRNKRSQYEGREQKRKSGCLSLSRERPYFLIDWWWRFGVRQVLEEVKSLVLSVYTGQVRLPTARSCSHVLTWYVVVLRTMVSMYVVFSMSRAGPSWCDFRVPLYKNELLVVNPAARICDIWKRPQQVGLALSWPRFIAYMHEWCIQYLRVDCAVLRTKLIATDCLVVLCWTPMNGRAADYERQGRLAYTA